MLVVLRVDLVSGESRPARSASAPARDAEIENGTANLVASASDLARLDVRDQRRRSALVLPVSEDSRTWQPRPDPAVHDPDRPGLRPHRHPPDELHSWVFVQDEVWVDYWGNEHEIALMAGDYVANVVAFCEERALWIWALVAGELMAGEVEEVIRGWREADARTATVTLPGFVPPADRDAALAWLHTLPLLKALRARPDAS